MACNDTDIPGDLRIYEEFGKQAWGNEITDIEDATIRKMISLGWLQAGAVIESALAAS